MKDLYLNTSGKNTKSKETGPKENYVRVQCTWIWWWWTKNLQSSIFSFSRWRSWNATTRPRWRWRSFRNSDNKTFTVENGAAHTVTVGSGGVGSFPTANTTDGAASGGSAFGTLQATAGGRLRQSISPDGGSGAGTGEEI